MPLVGASHSRIAFYFTSAKILTAENICFNDSILGQGQKIEQILALDDNYPLPFD